MGTDIYRYVVLSIDGKEVIIEFYSGQSVGLADLSAVFWVEALCSADSAFKWESGVFRANCPLTRHELFRKPSGDVGIEGGNIKSMADVEELLNKVNALIQAEKGNSAEKVTSPLKYGSYGFFGGEEGGRGSIGFNSVEEAQTFIDYVKTMEKKDDSVETPPIETPPIDVYFKTVRNGPEFISQYCGYPAETFDHFVESVEPLEVYYDSIEEEDHWKRAGVEENYWNTKAKYRLVMKSAEYLEHLKVSDQWDGR